MRPSAEQYLATVARHAVVSGLRRRLDRRDRFCRIRVDGPLRLAQVAGGTYTFEVDGLVRVGPQPAQVTVQVRPTGTVVSVHAVAVGSGQTSAAGRRIASRLDHPAPSPVESGSGVHESHGAVVAA